MLRFEISSTLTLSYMSLDYYYFFKSNKMFDRLSSPSLFSIILTHVIVLFPISDLVPEVYINVLFLKHINCSYSTGHED